MTTAKKSMAPRRKGKKQYSMVSFELDGFEGEFTMPKIDQMPLGVGRKFENGDIDALMDFLYEYAEDSAPVVDDLSGEEVQDFMTAWAKASGVEVEKSEA
ncbi:hypothetical protein [Brevibacterium sp. SMBL_HHYL_HB1]|uniref:hypothetical protein n=1 Tax=Brevibacterium sp. SMBL_HHYL_HB1 TaxID=2777556 RepID=UPI001BAA3097|nr:hypothetical protein [Brevibacterium sp. SMBL_HHYL_HB1]QUL79926.1 hypothetical protein IG171_03525 [Brevibacterium sp. SMBL_HHYL_HB1]